MKIGLHFRHCMDAIGETGMRYLLVTMLGCAAQAGWQEVLECRGRQRSMEVRHEWSSRGVRRRVAGGDSEAAARAKQS